MIQNTKCPVPQGQKPLNEYNSLKQSFGFKWTCKDTTSFLKGSTFLIILLFASSIGVMCNTPNWEKDTASFIMQVVVSSVTFFILIILRLYLAWMYIYDRLMKATVSYEESGWYDGQTWIKTPEILIQDRLTGTYEVLPILKRLENTLILSSTILTSNIIIDILK